MKIIVLTGGIATGKSTVSHYLRQKGYPVVDSDIIARQVVEPDTPGLARLVEAFGPQILTENGHLDRQVLGDIIFKNKALAEKLNQIIHPLIHRAMDEEIQTYKKQGQALVFLDIPLYYEVKKSYQEDQVWLVYVPESLQFQRLKDRNQYSDEHVRQRISSQLSIEDKVKQADIVINNQGSLQDLYAQVNTLLANLLKGEG